MGITETEYYKKLQKHYERKGIKAAAKKIVKRQIATTIADEVTQSQLTEMDKQIASLSKENLLAEKKDMHAQKKYKIKIKDKLAAFSTPMFIFSIITAVLSIFMSLAGISHVHTLAGLKGILKTRYGLPALLMACFQIATVVSSIIAYGAKRHFKKLNRLANLFRTSIFIASVYSNHMFLCDLIPEYREGVGIIFGWFFAAGADIMSNLFSTFSFALKNRMCDEKNNAEQNTSYLSKIWFCLTAKFRLDIDKAYKEKLDALNEFQKTGKTRKDTSKQTIIQTETNAIKQTKTIEPEQPKTNIAKQEKSDDAEQAKTTQDEKIAYFKYLVPDNIDVYEKKLHTFPLGTKLNKNMFGLDQKQWRQVRDYWVKQGLVRCHEKATYKAV